MPEASEVDGDAHGKDGAHPVKQEVAPCLNAMYPHAC